MRSEWVITTISGNPKILANSRVSDLKGALLIPDITQRAYYGKKEHKLVTNCF